MCNCEVTKNVVFEHSCRCTVYHNQNSKHLGENIGIIWHKHKHSMLVKANNAEYNVSQEKKNYSQWRYRHEKPACRLFKTSQESRE